MASSASDEDELLSINSNSDPENEDGATAPSFEHETRHNKEKSEKKEVRLSSKRNCNEFGKKPKDKNSSSSASDNADLENVNAVTSGNNSKAQNSSRTTVSPRELEITLSDDDEETESENNLASNPSTSNSDSSGYGLRRKRNINYAEVENGIDEVADDSTVSKKKSKKDVFDVISKSSSYLRRVSHNPRIIDNYTKCKIIFMDGTDSLKLQIVTKFFENCGDQFEQLSIITRQDDEAYTFLKNVLKTTTTLTRIDYRYKTRDDAYIFLKLLQDMKSQGHLSTLSSLKFVSLHGSETLAERHVKLLANLGIQFNCLEIGDALWEDVKPETIEKLLEGQKSCLETLVIHGGFKGDSDKERILITFPKMDKLKTLCICPNYGFISEIKDPYSKKQRLITLGANKEEPYKIAIRFTCDLPHLDRLVLGNLIEIEDLRFSTVRKLSQFKCGSYWNLSITFPSDSSRKALLESSVTELQFPDALKDPSFTVKVAKHFPNVKKVWMNLPSVPVLRAFFKAFENSNLEALYLKTQFDFESTMESCLLPNMTDVLRKNRATETLLETLKEYKHFDEYMKYYNVELPVQEEDLMEGHSAGIGSLKNLRVLHLEHIPRKLLIPIPDDERKWYDHNCKFMSTTFGYISYPLNYKCHKEILRLDLSEYIWKNIQISTEFTEDFHQAGFIDIPDEIIDVGAMSSTSTYSNYEEEEDLFIPIHRKETASGTHVKIMPSMLLPNFKAKSEND